MRRLGTRIVMLAMLCCAQQGRAQVNDGRVRLPGASDELRARGLEGLVGVDNDGESTFAFEYRLARSPAEGVCRLLAALATGDRAEPTTIVLRHANVSVTSLRFVPRWSEGAWRCGGYTLESSSYVTSPHIAALRSSRDAFEPPRILDFEVGTSYGFRWGPRWDPVEAHVAVAPRLRLRMWQGMEVSAELLIPIWNELPGETGYIRPGLVSLAQFVRLPGPTFARIAVGTFRGNRFGGDLQVRRFMLGNRFYAGLEGGYTGGISFPNGSIRLIPEYRTVVLGTAGAYVSRYDLFLEAAAGQFLYGDLGLQGTVTRRFGGVDVGFHATWTELGKNAGFLVVLPLLRGLAWGNQHVRIRPRPFIGLRYEYTRDTLEGTYYDAGLDLDNLLWQHHPVFLPHRWDQVRLRGTD